MSSINLKKNIIETIFVRGGILVLNLVMVWLVTVLWKAEGTGIRALFGIDLVIITVVCNIFTSSSVSYYIKKAGVSRLATQAYLWVFAVAGILAFLLSFRGEGSNLSVILFFTSILLGGIGFHASLFLGCQKIPFYNLLTLLQPLLTLIFMFLIYCLFDNKYSYYAFFYGQIISLLLNFTIAKIITCKLLGKIRFELHKNTIKNSFNFGWKTELSNLLHMLNCRVSAYALLFFTGIESVGVFALGVAAAEAIWIFSKSISLVQYSNVLQKGDTPETRKESTKVTLISLLASTVCITIIVFLPADFFAWIFRGEEFSYVKTVILLMSPGILAIASSGVYAHFFSATGRLNVLITKSAVGLLVTIVLSWILIPRLEIAGASIVNSTAYIVSSAILIIVFFMKKKETKVEVSPYKNYEIAGL